MDRTKLREALAAYFDQTLTPAVAADIEARACAVTSLHDFWPMPAIEGAAPEVEPTWKGFDPNELAELLGFNPDAVRFVLDIATWSHVYDDMIDRDKPISDERIHALMWKLLVGLPSNPFFAQHEALLRPVIVTGILNWHAANDIERGGDLEELRIAHAIRYSIGDVALMAMCITRGPVYAAQHARRLRLMLQLDTWAHYKSEHCK